MRVGNILSLLGAPGSGKTSVLRQIGDTLSQNGVAVGWVADDEPGAGVDVRRLQAIGIARDEAENPDERIIQRAEQALGAFPFEVFSEVGQTLDDAFVELANLYPDQPRALIVDSVQTCRTARSAQLDSPKDRVADVMKTVKRLARSAPTECMVLLSSEVSRGAYRARGGDADLAAGKESGAVEYDSDVVLMVRKSGLNVTVKSTSKNRIGDENGSALLRFDPSTASYVSPGSCPEVLSVDDRIVEAVRREPGLTGQRLQETVSVASRDTFTKVTERLRAENKLKKVKGKGHSFTWWPADGQSGQ